MSIGPLRVEGRRLSTEAANSVAMETPSGLNRRRHSVLPFSSLLEGFHRPVRGRSMIFGAPKLSPGGDAASLVGARDQGCGPRVGEGDSARRGRFAGQGYWVRAFGIGFRGGVWRTMTRSARAARRRLFH